jgi:hypothetical protein
MAILPLFDAGNRMQTSIVVASCGWRDEHHNNYHCATPGAMRRKRLRQRALRQ